MCMIYKKLFLILVLFISFLTAGAKVQAATDVTGWGWSDGTGWISFNCANTNSCATSNYKVTFSTTTTTGTFSGYAWSDGIGWISFGAGDGTHPNIATDLSTGSVTGWARALAGVGRTDGWDGWISMSGVNYETGPAYVSGNRGITFDTATGIFKGYAWGDTNVGWLTFNPSVGIPVTCAPNCGNTDTTSSFNLEVSAGSGWNSSASVQADQSGNAQIQVRWNSNNVNNVVVVANTQTNTNDWPNTPIGATKYNNTYNFLDDTADTGILVPFSGITTSTVVKRLALKYWNIERSEFDTVEVSITITPYGIPPNLNCPTPTNARLCSGSSYAPGVSTVKANIGLCSGLGTPCEFYCPQGFKLVNNSCRRSGIISEQ